MDIARFRMHSQGISGNRFETPGDVVRWLGAVQAQDYLGALWAVGLRLPHATEKAIEQALAERSIIRTWPLRGTLHFVAAADARWMLDLVGPRVIAANARRLQRDYGVDDDVLAHARDVLVQALRDGRQLTRSGTYQALEAAGISPSGQRGLQIIWRLAQEGLICFGARQGKQHTFVLLDEWAPRAQALRRDQTLAELAQRYFSSHGPATVRDFAWWSGLAAADAQEGLELAKHHLVHEEIDRQTYWLCLPSSTAVEASPSGYVLPAFDEYLVGYRERGGVLAPSFAKRMDSRNGVLGATIIVDGQVVGTWKRTLTKGRVVIEPTLFRPLMEAERRAVAAAARCYAAFLGLAYEVS